MQRINVSVVEGNEVEDDIDLEQIVNEAETALASALVPEDEPKDDSENPIKMEIYSERDFYNAFICGSGS